MSEGSGEDVELEVAAAFCALVVLLGQDDADDPESGAVRQVVACWTGPAAPF